MKSILFIALFAVVAAIGCNTPEKSSSNDTAAPPVTDSTMAPATTDTSTSTPMDTTTTTPAPNPTDTSTQK